MNHVVKFRANLLFAFILMLILSFAFVGLSATVHAQQNTSITPHSPEQFYVMDRGTTGTVQVNNLANLEVLLNIFANGAEILGLILGFVLILRASISGRKQLVIPLIKWQLSRRTQFVSGCVLMLIGLSIPGAINWLVASARDANLFT